MVLKAEIECSRPRISSSMMSSRSWRSNLGLTIGGRLNWLFALLGDPSKVKRRAADLLKKGLLSYYSV